MLNPNLSSDTIILHIVLEEGEQFDHEKLMACQYKVVEVLSGQHIVTADYNVLCMKYANVRPQDVPQNVLWKNIEAYFNLAPTEKRMLIIHDNCRESLHHSLVDRVSAFLSMYMFFLVNKTTHAIGG